MGSLWGALRGLFACAGGGGGHTTVVTRPGLFEATPDVSFAVLPPGPAASAAALTGPDTGVTSVCGQPGAPGAAADPIPWQLPQAEGVAAQQQQQQQPSQQQQQAWGSAISLYDKKPATGQRNGEPIADCWAAITYQAGAVLALADGVSWGSRPRLAARAAVHGFCSHLHAELVVAQQSQGSRSLSSNAVFAVIRAAVLAAQRQVLAAEGTLTTLVGAVVCRRRSGPGHVLLAVAVGDSPCYVWRAAAGCVEEVTYMPPLHGFHRDPRVCPGCLGYAVGDKPDLSNITFSLTQLQPGDMVMLASDGVADNFDPVMRKQALASGRSPQASSAAPTGLYACGSSPAGMLADAGQHLSPASCRVKGLSDMALVLREACSSSDGSSKHGSKALLQQQQHVTAKQQQHSTARAAQQQQQQQQKQVCSGADGIPPELLNAPGVVLPGVSNGGGGSDHSHHSHHSSRHHDAQAAALSRSSHASLPPFAGGAALTAAGAVGALMAFVTAATAEQRRVLEDPTCTRRSSTELAALLSGLPGKLDHASCVAYKVAAS